MVLRSPLEILSNLGRRLNEAAKEDATNQLMLRAVDRIKDSISSSVDPGRPPVRVKGFAAAQGVLMAFPLILLVVALAVGAFESAGSG